MVGTTIATTTTKSQRIGTRIEKEIHCLFLQKYASKSPEMKDHAQKHRLLLLLLLHPNQFRRHRFIDAFVQAQWLLRLQQRLMGNLLGCLIPRYHLSILGRKAVTGLRSRLLLHRSNPIL